MHHAKTPAGIKSSAAQLQLTVFSAAQNHLENKCSASCYDCFSFFCLCQWIKSIREQHGAKLERKNLNNNNKPDHLSPQNIHLLLLLVMLQNSIKIEVKKH